MHIIGLLTMHPISNNHKIIEMVVKTFNPNISHKGILLYSWSHSLQQPHQILSENN